MLNVNTTKITIVDETRECLSRQMMLTYAIFSGHLINYVVIRPQTIRPVSYELVAADRLKKTPLLYRGDLARFTTHVAAARRACKCVCTAYSSIHSFIHSFINTHKAAEKTLYTQYTHNKKVHKNTTQKHKI